MSRRPQVHVAIVNWNTSTSALLAASLYLASDGADVRVTIVDNASEPDQQEMLRAGVVQRPGLELRTRAENLGYGAAANFGLAGSGAQLVCVSNADLEPKPEMLAALAQVALHDSSVGLVGPRLTGTASGYHAQLPRPATLPLRAFAGRVGQRSVSNPPSGSVREVEQPAGACLLLRRDVWEALGGFDPGFLLWFEDVDLARRSLAAGYRNVVAGDAVALHRGAEAFAQLAPARRQEIRLHSLERYAAKHHPRMSPLVRLAVSAALPLRKRF
ncbi:MAG: glycosyltransferase [Solirubrobacteraceae bacterium]